MYCKKCGSPLSEGEKFCKNCGESVESNASFASQPEVVNNVNGQAPSQGLNFGSVNDQNLGSTPNNNMTSPDNDSTKKNKMGVYIGVGVAVVVVIIVAIIALPKLFKSDDSDIEVAQNSTYKVSYAGFTLNIPTDLVYEISGDNLLIGNEERTWVVNSNIIQGSFSKVSSNLSALKQQLATNGIDVSDIKDETVSGVELVEIAASYGGQNILLVYGKINSMYVFVAEAINLSNDFEYAAIKKIAPIIKSAEYVGETNNLEMNEFVSLQELGDLVK